jgi:predicted MFS family arabinose efflux permease
MAATGRFWPFLAIFWGFGLSLSVFRQSLDILLFKENPLDAARRFGQFNAWRMGGMMLGTLAGGLMVYLWRFPLTLRLFGVALLLMLWPAIRLPLTGGMRAPVWQYRRDFLTRPVLFFAAWLFLFTLHWGAEATSLALFLQHNLGLAPMGVGAYMAGEFGVISVTAYLYGRLWAGKLTPLTFLAVALLASGSGHILMTWPNLPWSFAMRALHGFGDGLILMETYTTISRLFHVDRIGGNSSLITLVTTLGVFAGSLIFGPLGANFGYQTPLIISGIITLALLPLAYAGLKE